MARSSSRRRRLWAAERVPVTPVRYGDVMTKAPPEPALAVADERIAPDEWHGAVADVAGPQIVVGGPGTGKTEFLVRRALRLLEQGVPGEEVLVLSFGRRGVADLDERIRHGLDRARPAVTVSTFHSLAAAVMEARFADRGWTEPPHILTGPEQTSLVRELLDREDPVAWSPASRGLLSSATFANEVTDFMLRASEQMLGPDDIAAFGRDDWRGLAEFVDRYRSALVVAGRIDYGMLLAEATAILESHGAILPVRYVLVDEYQDTTLAQARLLAAIAGAAGNVTAAADPYQSIYSFRGAAVQNVARFPETFRAANGSPGRRLVLTTSFRTPAAILTAAESVAGHDLPGAAGPVLPAAGSGRVDVHRFDQHTAEAEWIAGEILRLHLVEHLPYSRMAVFVRSKRRFLPELSRALERRGIPHDPPDSRLVEQPAVRFVLDLLVAATSEDAGEVTRCVRRLLLGPWFRVPLGVLRDLERSHTAGGRTWVETLDRGLPEAAVVARLLVDGTWATEVPAVEGAWRVWSSVPQLAAVALDPDRRSDREAWTSLMQVLGRWNERNPNATLAEYARLIVEEEFEARPLLSYSRPDDDRVTVTTLHQAKGLEFAVVFIADTVEGVFPDLRVRDSLLGVRHLLPDVPHDAGDYRRFRLQEERRLAYTGMTRASQRIVWTATAAGFEEGRGIPSRFLALVAGARTVEEAVTAPEDHLRPVTHAEAEALLRRLAADPGAALPFAARSDGGGAFAHAPLRAAAIRVLAEGPRWGLRSPAVFAGFRERGPDTGLLGERLRLSPSQADAFAACPRRYALERRLGIGETAGVHAELGMLLHDVLEAVESAAMEAGLTHGRLDDALEELDQRFVGESFGGEPYATAWKRRATTVLTELYERWPDGGAPLHLERELSAEIAGVEWVGRADRIERRGGGYVVVDYKTGSSHPTVREAAESLQLGFYVLASMADPEVCAAGEPKGAELWFPWAGRSRKTLLRRHFEMANLQLVEERLAAVADGIRSERWQATPSEDCDRCAVRIVCPAQPSGREGFVT